MKYIVNEESNTSSNKPVKAMKKKCEKLKPLKTAVIAFLIFTFVLGFLYTLSVTVFAQALFPHQANGSLIEVTLKDGSKKLYGSELVGQSYLKIDSNGNHILEDEQGNKYITNKDGEYYLDSNSNLVLDQDETTKLAEETKTNVIFQGEYLIGRFNQGAPSNSAVTTDKYQETIESRRDALIKIGYDDEYNTLNSFEGIPSELLTESGSGVDPEISYEVAMYQAPLIAELRNLEVEEVRDIIDNHTKGKFLGIFGEKRVNVLLVNLELDGLI